MAKKNKKASKFRDWFNRAQEKKRIIILDVDNYEEKRSYTTSKFNVFIILSFFTILLGFLPFALISYSSLKNLIPGYPNPTQQQEIKNKSIIIDQKLTELLSKTEKEKSYINNVMQILNGSIPINEKDTSWKKLNLMLIQIPMKFLLQKNQCVRKFKTERNLILMSFQEVH